MLDLIEELRRLAEDTEPEVDMANFIDLANRMEKAYHASRDNIEGMAEQRRDLEDRLEKEAILRKEASDTAAAYRACFEDIMRVTLPGELHWLDARALVEMVHNKMVNILNKGDIGLKLRDDLRQVEHILDEFEKAQDSHYDMRRELLSKRIQVLVNHYVQTAATALSNEKAFRDDVLTFIRSFGMVVDMAGNAGTHAEKNARLRGLSELLESAAHKLQNQRLQFGYRWYDHVDIFKTDYPVREFVRRIHEQDDEIRKLKQQLQPQNEDSAEND